MILLESYVRSKQNRFRDLMANPLTRLVLKGAAAALAGFFFSAASLHHQSLPLAMAAVWTCSRPMAILEALGGIGGYVLFWGSAGYQSAVWLALALICVLFMDGKTLGREAPLLAPACACLIVAATGVVFQNFFRDGTSVGMYLLRVALGGGCTWLFQQTGVRRSPILQWLTSGFCVLALCQIAPIPYLGFGYLVSAAFTMAWAFPAAAVCGLALDLSQISPVPMSAVMIMSYLSRLVPGLPRWSLQLAPSAFYLITMGICGQWHPEPLPALLAGGILGTYLPGLSHSTHRKGEVGAAQVRLEVAAGVLQETQEILLEVQDPPLDEGAMVSKAAEQACSGCPCRKNCRDRGKMQTLSGEILHWNLLTPEELPVSCRKSGRMMAELHRSQERARSMGADRKLRGEYRAALIQQYGFLSDFLRNLSDQLPRRVKDRWTVYEPQVQVFGNRPEQDNGDRVSWFPGVMGKYYVLLCDGMGTGMGAVQEGKSALRMLRRMLTAGFPAEDALRSLNSLCALRSRAGAVTADLAELDLHTGRATLYKWGAAPSYLINEMGAEKIGTAGPPPGLSLADGQEKRSRLSLGRGQTLVMVSDGVEEEEALRCCQEQKDSTREDLARSLMDGGKEDDATVITVCLRRAQL